MLVQRCTKIGLLLAILVVLGSFTGVHSVQAGSSIHVAGNPHTPLQVQLTLDTLPAIGGHANATVTVVSRGIAAPNTIANLVLPATMQVINGITSWHGDLAADQTIAFSAVVKVSGKGNTHIKATARRDVDPTTIWADQAIIYFNADTDASTQEWVYGNEPAVAVSGAAVQAPDNGVSLDQQALHQPLTINAPLGAADDAGPPADFSPSPKATPNTPAGTLTITGKWYYLNRAGATTYVKLRTELLDASNNHLAWAWSDWDGSFSFTVANPGQFKVRAYTYYNHVSMSLSALRVIPNGTDSGDNFGIGETYYVTTNTFGPYADGTINIGSWRPSDSYAGRFAWWIYDDMLQAFFYPYNCTPECTINGTWMPDGSTVEWTPTSTDGTYYSRGGNIHLEAADKDSESTIVHEYGHNVMWNVYGETMPTSNCPSPHYIQYISALNCAWTEGWANFFSMAVRNEGFYQWPSGATLNLETPTWSTANWDDGQTVEGRVAGALWDMIDNANDGLDTWDAPNGFREVWDVVYNQNDDNYPEVWAAWVARGHSKHYGLITSYYNTIDYDTAPTLDVLPNITRTGAGPFNNVIDLWNYASDPESFDSQLTYTIQSVSNPAVGASVGSGFIDIDPVNWWGTASVTVKVSDGAKSASRTFNVTIKPLQVFIPLVSK